MKSAGKLMDIILAMKRLHLLVNLENQSTVLLKSHVMNSKKGNEKCHDMLKS